METSFEIFGLTGYRLGLFTAIGVLLLLAAMLLLARKRKIQPASVCVLAICGMVCGIVFARLFYCLINLSEFVEAYENPLLMLRFFDGGLSVAGLLCGLLVAVPLAAAVCKEKCAELADLLFVPMGLLFAFVYLGQQDTGLGIGKIVEEGSLTAAMPWLFLSERMGINVEYRMLVYLYQAALCLLMALVMLPLYLVWQKKDGFRAGETAMVSLSLYGAAMVVLESLRDDGHMLIIFLRIGQVVAALLPMVSLIVLTSRCRRLLGKANASYVLAWVCVILYIAGIAILEFALDGRLAMVEATAGQYYAVMAALSALMAVLVFLMHGRVMRLRAAGEAA